MAARRSRNSGECMNVPRTPAANGTMKLRLLVVSGSQTGTCTRISKKMADNWGSRGVLEKVDVFEGNELAHETEDLASLKENYDVLVVCTSSFGEGDPPENFNEFLLKIMQASTDGSKPLAGMQHAVLGEGSSVYRETFQNCPRLTDKYLEECGSRRFVARHETDVGGTEDESVSRNLFREAVFTALSRGLPDAGTPAAAEWSKPRQAHEEPTDQITLKSVADLGGKSGQSLSQIVFPLVVLSVAVAGGIYYNFFMSADEA